MMHHAAHRISVTFPVLQTERLTLREPRDADVATAARRAVLPRRQSVAIRLLYTFQTSEQGD